MRTLLAGLTLLVLASSAGSQTVSLFNGSSLSDWSGDPTFWSVEDGCIVGRSTVEVPCTRTTYLAYTGGEYEDFDLSLDFWIDGERSNSGIQFRSLSGADFQMTGYQADMDSPQDWTGGLYETGPRGIIARRGLRMIQNGGHTAYELLGDLAELSKLGAPGEWHSYRIRALGTRIQTWIDGTLTCDFDDREARIEGGLFGIQLHKGPPMEVRYRNISVTRLAATPPPPSQFGSAQWIWSTEDAASIDQPSGVARFERAVRATGAVKRASIAATCDNGVELSIDDIVFAGGEEWSAPFEVDLPPKLRRDLSGKKPLTLRADCWNSGGPAGFIARLEIEYEDGRVEHVETNRWWKVRAGGDALPAAELGPIGLEPWGIPTGTSSGVPDLPLAASKLELSPGFVAKELLRVPRDYGSWVAMTMDPKGRLIASAEAKTGLFRVTLTEDEAPLIEPLDLSVDIGGAQGLLAVGSDLYVMKNVLRATDNGLYRARDTTGDDRYDEVRLLTPVNGYGEHGPHAIRLAPDGAHLEIIAGNSTALPAGAATRAKGDWPDDQLLPSLPDTFGHGNQMHDHGGWLGRCDLDGESWEILCTGMRNAYSFAYDAKGQRFTYDSDMEWDMGAPWYRAPRILHLVPGVEYGWRRGSGKVMGNEPDTLPSVASTGPASPVGVLHGKDGRFPGAFGDALFVGDWTRGIVYSLELQPSDDTFTAEPRPFISGRPFPITDMAWLPDGSMAVLTGGRGRRSAIYSVAALQPRGDEAPAATDVAEVTPPEADGPVSRQLRRLELEAASPMDPWAIEALRNQDPVGWLALARVGGTVWQERLFGSILRTKGQLTRSALRAVELSLARAGTPTGPIKEMLLRRIESECAADSSIEQVTDELDVKRVEVLVALGSDQAPAYAVPRMLASQHQERAIDFALQLRMAELGWTPELAKSYLDFLHVDAAAFYGGRSVEGYVTRIREEALETAGAAIPGGYVAPEPAEGTDADGFELGGPLFVRQWDVRTLAPLIPTIPDAKDFVKGERAFRRSGCYACHRVGEEGGGTGPDLTHAGGRFTPRDLLIAIIEPSRDISDQYIDTEVWTHDMTVQVGRLVEADEEWTTLRLPPSSPGAVDGELVDVPAEEIHLVRPHPISRMPSGTLDCLLSDEIVQMLGWLLAEK